MTPARKTTGRVAFVGSGPGDAGLLTVRAQELLAKAEVVVTDPDVPAGVLAFASADAEVRPAVGEPAEVAKDLTAEAKAGRLVLRLVAGDPLTQAAAVAEVQAVARTSAVFDIVPGVSPGAAVPAYAGVALGGTPRSPQPPARSCCTRHPATSPRRPPPWSRTGSPRRPRSR
jgi:uroporphyrinogen III methyltransferase/synthase